MSPEAVMSVNLEHGHVLAKQRAAIEVLKKDNSALAEELRLENNYSVAPTTASGSALLAQLQDETDTLTRKIGLERPKLADSQERRNVLKKKVERQRLSMGGTTAAQMQNAKANRSVKQQESRLQVAWQSRNKALAATGELRSRIEGLRRERLACKDILRKSDFVLLAHRSAMAKLLTLSATAGEQREKVLSELISLQNKSHRVQANSEAERNQLSHVIQQDRQARENARQQDIEEREQRTQGLVKAEIGGQRRATAVGWGLARNKAAQNASAMRMAQLTEDFAAVQAAIGTDNPGALAEQLIAAEDSKFQWFSYVNELNAEHEVLQGQIHALESELRIARAEATAQQERRLLEHDRTMYQLRVAKDEAETYEARAGRALQRVNALRNAVTELFAAADCDSEIMRELLGSGGVTAANLMQYLGIVEQTTYQLLQDCFSKLKDIPESRSAQPKSTMQARQQEAQRVKLNPGMGTLVIEPPSLQSTLPGHDGAHPATEEADELLLDKKALQAAAERALARRLEEGHSQGTSLRPANMIATAHKLTVRK